MKLTKRIARKETKYVRIAARVTFAIRITLVTGARMILLVMPLGVFTDVSLVRLVRNRNHRVTMIPTIRQVVLPMRLAPNVHWPHICVTGAPMTIPVTRSARYMDAYRGSIVTTIHTVNARSRNPTRRSMLPESESGLSF